MQTKALGGSMWYLLGLAMVISVACEFIRRPRISTILDGVLAIAGAMLALRNQGLWPMAFSLYWAFMAGRASKIAWPRRT
ncbi:MAG: hypothetical protein V1778_02420 [bacterium]